MDALRKLTQSFQFNFAMWLIVVFLLSLAFVGIFCLLGSTAKADTNRQKFYKVEVLCVVDSLASIQEAIELQRCYKRMLTAVGAEVYIVIKEHH